MLFRQDILQGIAEGRVTVAFRRWRRAAPAEGSTLRTPAGVVTIERVDVIDEGDITPGDVARTGMSVDDLRASIAGEGRLVRMEIRLSGADPRVALRDRAPSAGELDTVATNLATLDRAASQPWTLQYLQLIGQDLVSPPGHWPMRSAWRCRASSVVCGS